MPDLQLRPRRFEAVRAGRVVVKVGSAALGTSLDSVIDTITFLSKEVGEQARQPREIVLVVSGAVAVGRMLLRAPDSGYASSSADRITARESAAVGQAWLTARFRDAFDSFGVHVAQLLVDETATSTSADSVSTTIRRLLDRGCIPVINENDSGAEGLIGNNDMLAARLARQLGADLLVFLTDVPGVLGHDGRRVLLRITAAAHLRKVPIQPAPPGAPGTGGMAAKLSAAAHAADHGIPVLIGALADLNAMLAGHPVGTWIAWPPAATLPPRSCEARCPATHP
ncbi:hypothetical protein [Amycolatopsis sp. 3B14]|uniref:amino acid kinase family protein n=1 Tax=Amycolatopsis sp. 3B14 TaxID=3243600 RepID=UPI003D974053